MRAFPISLLAACLLPCITAFADEGMWLYNQPPLKLLQERYNFSPAQAWLEHLQKSSIRFEGGGSGAFVSEDGLIIATHHMATGALRKFSDQTHDYLRDGFYAATPAEEKPCAGLELDVLNNIEDVTARVNGPVRPGLSTEDVLAARQAAIAKVEKEAGNKTGMRSSVVASYGESKYYLYRYKRYSDVRMVFAPEQQAAAFGGSLDAYEFPRFDFDVCLFRAYEEGKPAKVADFLKWNARGVSDNQLIFISGNPEPAGRQLTFSELNYLRDDAFPFQLQRLYRQEVVLQDWSALSDENARRASESLVKVRLRRKAIEGREAALLDPELMAAKWDAEKKLRETVTRTPELQDTVPVWDQITAAQRIIAANAPRYAMLEDGLGFNSSLFDIAHILLESSIEKSKPDSKRLQEYQDSNLPSLEQRLFADEPIYQDLEILKLTDSLSWLAGELGSFESDTPDLVLKEALADQTPRVRATALVTGTTLQDVAVRKTLYNSATFSDFARMKDPMIELALAVNPDTARLHSIAEIEEEVKRQGHEKIAAARSFLEKGTFCPATDSTLRFAFGTVRGYETNEGKIPFQTTLSGLFERAAAHHGQAPFDLPPRWAARKNQINLATPFNFVSTADIAGGNSGSPVIDAAGEFVGLVFDGNAPSMALDFVYSDTQARAVSLDARAITETLRHVYDAPKLADELESGKRAR
jgi:hypothetical protein